MHKSSLTAFLFGVNISINLGETPSQGLVYGSLQNPQKINFNTNGCHGNIFNWVIFRRKSGVDLCWVHIFTIFDETL